MKNLIFTSALLYILLIEILVAGVAQTNFSGTWVLDPKRSYGWNSPKVTIDSDVTIIVTHDNDKGLFTVETNETIYLNSGEKIAPQKLTYSPQDLASKSVKVVGVSHPVDATFERKWQEEHKILEARMNFATGELCSRGNRGLKGRCRVVTVTEWWELEQEGKVLKVQRFISSRLEERWSGAIAMTTYSPSWDYRSLHIYNKE